MSDGRSPAGEMTFILYASFIGLVCVAGGLIWIANMVTHDTDIRPWMLLGAGVMVFVGGDILRRVVW